MPRPSRVDARATRGVAGAEQGAGPARVTAQSIPGRPSAPKRRNAVSQDEPAGVDRLYAEHLDDAVHGQVGIDVELDEGVDAIGEPVDLAGARERGLVDEREGLVARHGGVGV